MGKNFITRLRKIAGVNQLTVLKQAAEQGKFDVDGICENDPDLGPVYGMSYEISQLKSGLNKEDFKTVCDELESMQPEKLAEVVGMSKAEIADIVSSEHNTGVDDKDFGGGASVSGTTLYIELYFSGSDQYTDD